MVAVGCVLLRWARLGERVTADSVALNNQCACHTGLKLP